ncbi:MULTISPECIES: bestrophin-like domain [unclassified Bradyrhizobium]|uniref:bestrophin-like domain n=1 Tax=unclassified Bradyrhizobium TaxID=2631580 RepID=UPI002FF3BEF3
MSDWLHNLPVWAMALVVFGFTYLLAIAVFLGVTALATEERAKSFKTISPGMLPVLGIMFGLFVAFTAAQVWNDGDRAAAAVSREASALRAAMLLAAGLPAENEAKLRGLVRDYVEHSATVEWPMMARQTASLRAAPPALVEALRLVVAIAPQGEGQQNAQREIISALQSALDARRQRIIVSQAEVNRVKWWCLYLQAICELLVIAIVHCDNRLASAIALALFATGVAASVLLIAAHDRPFTGQISIGPEPLLQIMPSDLTSR